MKERKNTENRKELKERTKEERKARQTGCVTGGGRQNQAHCPALRLTPPSFSYHFFTYPPFPVTPPWQAGRRGRKEGKKEGRNGSDSGDIYIPMGSHGTVVRKKGHAEEWKGGEAGETKYSDAGRKRLEG
jgi:hypothetical protein